MSGFKITKPISNWNRDIKVNFRDFFKGLTKAAIDGFTQKWGNVITDFTDVGAAISLSKKKPAETAWLLIRRALERAIVDLVKEYFQSRDKEIPENVDSIVDQLDLSLERQDLMLTSDFFDQPGKLPIIDLISSPLIQWFGACGVTESEAKAIVSRLRSYFVFALFDEWRSRSDDYQIVREALLNTPFHQLESQELAWNRYNAVLARKVEEPVFDAAFGIRQIYVPLRAWYSMPTKDETPFDSKKETRIVCDLEEELIQWASKEEARDAIRIVSGGPGSGKSTFAKMFAWQLSAGYQQREQRTLHQQRVLFIPLHHFSFSSDLPRSVFKYARDSARLPRDPLDPDKDEKRLLLIFDGLDELASQGSVGYRTVRDFISAIQDAVFSWNQGGERVKVLISGRTIVINELERIFSRPGQIIHLIPYIQDNRGQYKDPKGLLDKDQRHQWWKQYIDCTGKPYQEFPKKFIHRDLHELTAQPLVNYLIAIALDRFDIKQETNLNSIYQHLISRVFKRPWEPEQHPTLQDFNEEEFFTTLEEIAVAIWQGNGRAATESEILVRCRGGMLEKLLEQRLKSLETAAGEGVTRLITAFYFQRAEGVQGAEPAFEFSHKSFGEYLTARRLVRQVKIMVGERHRNQQDRLSGWSEEEALRRWIELCGPKALNRDLFRFITWQVALEYKDSQDNVAEWQKVLDKLLEWDLRYGMPMHVVVSSGLKTFKEQSIWARNAEETMLAMRFACAQVSGPKATDNSQIEWPEVTSLGTLVKRLQGQRSGHENVLAMDCLGYLDAKNQTFYMSDFFCVNFSFSKLSKTEFAFANLKGANLMHANLEEANLEGANLESANLEGANLRNAKLVGANLREVKFKNADLKGANLDYTDLTGANFENARVNSLD